MSKKLENKSLSERLTASLVENFNGSDSDSQDEDTPKVTHFDEQDYNFQPGESKKLLSDIRKRNIKLLSEQSSKYSGVIATRNVIKSDDEDDNDSKADDATPHSETNQVSQSDESGVEEDNESDASHVSSEAESPSENEETPETELVSAENKKLETEKGICVQNQLSVWEKLLEIRIHSQKILNKANSLPNPDDFTKLSSHKEFKDPAQEVKKSAEALLEKLLETKANLSSQFSEIKQLGLSSRKRNSSSTVTTSDPPSKKFAGIIEDNFEKFRPYRNSVLLKWEDRTKLLNPSGGTKRKHLTDDFDIIHKVDNILMKRDELVAKSQKVKGTYKLFGQKESEELDTKETSSPHIYDDTDFYHSQLRELIEFKSNASTNAYDVTKQFAELQKLRQKMKKKVDTRASKGRKIRYVVHNKLVNFMAPNDPTEWTEESKNELYRSLFVT